MNHERLDIVNLIENNPLEKLSNDYQTKLLDKIKETFSDSDQQLLHELLREQANELQNQLREQKTLVEEKEKLLLEKDKELEKYKEKVYEKVEKRGFVIARRSCSGI